MGEIQATDEIAIESLTAEKPPVTKQWLRTISNPQPLQPPDTSNLSSDERRALIKKLQVETDEVKKK